MIKSIVHLGGSGLLLLASAFPALSQSGNFFVNPDTGLDTNTGMSWTLPFKTIDKALSVATAALPEIWVKADSLNEHVVPGGTRDSTFLISDSIHLRGGFLGTEAILANRPSTLFTDSILTGDINGDSGSGTLSDDAYHVVTIETTTDGVIIDGFLIQYGNADGSSTLASNSGRGGGILFEDNSGGYHSMKIRNIVVENCQAKKFGGGIYVDAIGTDTAGQESHFARVTVRDCQAIDNSASPPSGDGGGIYVNRSGGNVGVTGFYNCIFDGNIAKRGGAAFTDGDQGIVGWQNCLFMDGSAQKGGGMFISNPGNMSLNAQISHCTFAYNEASIPSGSSGGGSALFINNAAASTLTVTSCIMYSNVTKTFIGSGSPIASVGTVKFGSSAPTSSLVATYSDIQLDTTPAPGWFGTGCINTDPMFFNGGARVLRLQATSPCIDTADDNSLLADYADLDGDTVLILELTPRDLGETLREQDIAGASGGIDAGNTLGGAISDMGAFEFRAQ